MKVGVNYVPRSGWFYSWLDSDSDEAARDFDAIAQLGLDHVRVFPLWPVLQPNASHIRAQAVEDVRTLAQLATQRGLTVSVDVLQGHMSSFDFLPAWTQSWHQSNIFTDPTVVQAQGALVRALAEALRDVDGTTGLSLGNEIVQFAAERHPLRHELTTQQAGAWLTQLLSTAEEYWPAGQHSFSFDDDLVFEPTQPFTPRHALECGDIITVHSWVFGKIGQHYGKDHPRLVLLARYLLELMRAWQTELGQVKPLWLQEIGAPLNYLSAKNAPAFVSRTLSHVAAVPGVDAVTWWCSHDVHRSLTGFPAVEYDLGLFDSEGNVKPVGQALSQWIANQAPQPETPDQAPQPETPDQAPQPETPGQALQPQEPGARPIAIPSVDHEDARVLVRPSGQIFEQWAQAIERGAPRALQVTKNSI